MRKNVGSQYIGAQLVSATDGSDVTSGTTTVYGTGDNGSQTSWGTATHKGNGFWIFAPSQANTNYDHIAFTFVNSSAISVTVQVYTTYPQTGDSYARLGSPAGADVSADIAAVKSDSAAILDDTGTSGVVLPQAQADKVWTSAARTLTSLGSSLVAEIWNALTSGMSTAGSVGKKLADWVLGTDSKALISTDAQDLSTTLDVNAKTVEDKTGYTASTVSDKTGYSISGTKQTLDDLNDLDAAGVRGAVGLAAANLDTQIAAIPDASEINAEVVDALNVDTYTEPGQGAPGVNVSLVAKIGYLYKALRNKITSDGSDVKLYNDAGDTVDQKWATAEAGGTVTRDEAVTGP